MQHMFISNEQPTALWLTIDTTDDIDDVYIHACCEDSDGNYNELEGRRSYLQVADYAHKLAVLKPDTGDVDLAVTTSRQTHVDFEKQPELCDGMLSIARTGLDSYEACVYIGNSNKNPFGQAHELGDDDDSFIVALNRSQIERFCELLLNA